MFQKIALVYKDELTENGQHTLDNVKRHLRNRDVKLIRISELEKDSIVDKDIVIVVGGDGTFLFAASYSKIIPVLGINGDMNTSLGYLTLLNRENLDSLGPILDGEYDIDTRIRARVKLNGQTLVQLALNEVLIGSNHLWESFDYELTHRNITEQHRDSGVIIATNTGSTALYSSAGGNPYTEEELRFRTVLYHPSQLFEPKQTEGRLKDNETLSIKSNKDTGVVAIDCRAIYPFNSGDVAEVFKSVYPLRVVVKKR